MGGEAVARRLRSDGFKVVICDMKDSSSLASEIGASFAHCDVAEESQVADAVKLAVSEHGGVAGAVNCAGVAIAQKVLSKRGVHSLDAFMKVVRINLGGTFNVVRLTAEQMSKQEPHNQDGERGVIVNTASVA